MVNVFSKIATTDCSPKSQIVQVALVDPLTGKQFNRFIYPSGEIQPEATDIHGIHWGRNGKLYRDGERLPAVSIRKRRSISNFHMHLRLSRLIINNVLCLKYLFLNNVYDKMREQMLTLFVYFTL